MNPEQTAVLRDLDPVEVGRRIKEARLARGLTQTELADGAVSVGMISRIEAGQRRVQPEALERFANRLAIPAAQLLGTIAITREELRLELDYAELALESGQAEEARSRSAQILERTSDVPAFRALRDRAGYVHALALEAVGKIDAAIMELEALAEKLPTGVLLISAGIALSRCYRESGDYARAVETAERGLRAVARSPLDNSDEAVRLTATLAAAHFERGDTGQAVRVIRRAVAKAEGLDSADARAAAYWNASVMEADRGNVTDAVGLAERALNLLRESQSARGLARMHIELGTLELLLDPPEVDSARRNLESAIEQSAWANISPADKARANTQLARAHLLTGETDAARELARSVAEEVATEYPMVAAEARSIEGQALLRFGDQAGASVAYRHAISLLTAAGADRGAAQLWFELAELLQQIGDESAAMSAYRSAAAATGLRSTAPVAMTV